MSHKSNVIDFFAKRKTKSSEKVVQKQAAPIVDMSERRQEILDSERREVKRTILTEFVSANVVLPSHGLQKVTLHDISENGLAFDLDSSLGHFRVGEEIAMRVYLNKSTYFPFIVRIKNVRAEEEGTVYRHGVNFSKEGLNTEALHHFVKFIETVSASLQHDGGDIMVSNLGFFPPSAS